MKKRELFSASLFFGACVAALFVGFDYHFVHFVMAAFFVLLVGPFPIALVIGEFLNQRNREEQ